MSSRFTLILAFGLLLIPLISGVAWAGEKEQFPIVKVVTSSDSTTVQVGLDWLVQDHFRLLGKHSVALIANRGSRTKDGQHLFDILQAQGRIPLKALFFVAEPESEVPFNLSLTAKAGGKEARLTILDASNYMLTQEMVDGAELLLIDLQDNGWWFSSALLVMVEALKYSARYNIPLIVLDRPNPLGAQKVEGPLALLPNLAPEFLIPVRHGMTLGELALLMVKGKWIIDKPIQLTIVPMANFRRSDAAVAWPTQPLSGQRSGLSRDQAYLWGAMQLVTATNLSYGAGTEWLYEVIGAPWVSGPHMVAMLEREHLTGVTFYPFNYTPRATVGGDPAPAFGNETCSGVQIRILDWQTFEPVRTIMTILYLANQLYPHHFRWKESERLKLLQDWDDFIAIAGYGGDLGAYLASIQASLSPFQRLRARYLLYP